jgi:uncharacterized membrane protein required for colicin V production
MFTGMDVIISIIILSTMLLGFIRGFVGCTVDLLGIAGGISLASFVYRGPVALLSKFDIKGDVVELVCFLITSLLLILTIILILEVLRRRVGIKHIVDRLFGILPGILEGSILSSLLFITMSLSFNSAMEIQQSRLAGYITRFIPPIYEKTDRIGINIPKMVYIPKKYTDEFNPENKEIQFLRINFSQFEGFTCMECGDKVRFEGYFLRIGAAMVPKVVCEKCGRISCGCQTYEGFHKIYGVCPVEVAKQQKIRFDCGRWPNYKLITPRGPCPVDGNTLKLWEWIPPTLY